MHCKLSLLSILLLGISLLGQSQPVKKKQQNKTLKILLISDLNDSYGSVTYSNEVHDMVSRMNGINPDMILCAGDMVAGQKASLTPEQLKAMWQGFDSSVFNPIYQLQIPFGFTVGNHDASPGYANDRAAATTFWQNNKSKTHLSFVDDTHFPYYFSYIKNNVFFLSWDASSATIPLAVKDWMEQQLSSRLAKKAKGRIVLGHLPLYAIVAAKNKPGEVINDADETLAFLKKNKVAMYISGHQHAYFPATKRKVTLLHSGCLGGGPRQLLDHDTPPQKAYALLQLKKRRKKLNVSIEGFTASDHQTILLHSLPETITGFNGTVQRVDIGNDEL